MAVCSSPISSTILSLARSGISSIGVALARSPIPSDEPSNICFYFKKRSREPDSPEDATFHTNLGHYHLIYEEVDHYYH